MRAITTVYSQHSHNWSDDSTSRLSVPISKGQRLIIVHTGGRMRFVPGAFLMFKCNKKSCVFFTTLFNILDHQCRFRHRTWKKHYIMGPTALLSFQRKSYSGFLRSEKIHRPRPGSNPWTSDQEASMITTGPPRSTNWKTGDYHHEMNAVNYVKWLTEKLIPNLPPKSVLVIDNSPYHDVQLNKIPTSSSNKKIMQDWLISNNVPFNEKMLKVELYSLIKLISHCI